MLCLGAAMAPRLLMRLVRFEVAIFATAARSVLVVVRPLAQGVQWAAFFGP